MIYQQRTYCIFCKENQFERLFDSDYEIPLGNFVVDSPQTPSYFMPYNVLYCKVCGTIQNEYIGDLNLIYENNFAGAFGSIRSTHNLLFADFILDNPHVDSIAEVGAGNGELSDIIIEKKNLSYTIIDPSYGGNVHKKYIVSKYLEDCSSKDIKCNTIVMSHVFEHFYNPSDIISKLKSIPSVQHIYISLPDLEAFIEDGTYHVLNSEHTFFVTNQFMKDIFEYYGFTCKRQYFHQRHSVFFEFIREPTVEFPFPKNSDTKRRTIDYFKKLINNINKTSIEDYTDLPQYIWPCSMHTLFALSFGLHKEKITAVLDNSPLKIGKYLYGSSIPCLSFQETIQEKKEKLIILAGGCYTKEVIEQASKNPYNKIVIL